MVGALNYQLEPKTTLIGKHKFDKDLSQIMKSYYPDDNLGTIAERYFNTFQAILGESSDENILQELEKDFENADILGENNTSRTDGFESMSIIKTQQSVTKQELERHAENIKKLDKIEKKLELINQGKTAYERDLKYI